MSRASRAAWYCGSRLEMLLIARSSTPAMARIAASITRTMPKIASEAGTRRRVIAWYRGAQMTATKAARRNGTRMPAEARMPATTTTNAAAVRR